MPRYDDAPSLTVIRFPNLCGALVTVTATDTGMRTRYAWSCAGCFDMAEGGGLQHNRDQANDHSAACRALRHPERPAS